MPNSIHKASIPLCYMTTRILRFTSRAFWATMLCSYSLSGFAQGDKDTGHSLDETVIKVQRELEEWRYGLLAKVQGDGHHKIKPFTTDGCSGGMSDGWQYMARALPVFKEQFGDRPPWEACCVTHDRAYWTGESQHGFDLRLQADQALRKCVFEFGQSHAEEYAEKFKLNKALIEYHHQITAEWMFRAVRLGGQPCTLFPWRWGYGWPLCGN